MLSSNYAKYVERLAISSLKKHLTREFQLVLSINQTSGWATGAAGTQLFGKSGQGASRPDAQKNEPICPPIMLLSLQTSQKDKTY